MVIFHSYVKLPEGTRGYIHFFVFFCHVWLLDWLKLPDPKEVGWLKKWLFLCASTGTPFRRCLNMAMESLNFCRWITHWTQVITTTLSPLFGCWFLDHAWFSTIEMGWALIDEYSWDGLTTLSHQISSLMKWGRSWTSAGDYWNELQLYLGCRNSPAARNSLINRDNWVNSQRFC